MAFELGPRRGQFWDITAEATKGPLSEDELAAFERLDLIYRATCAVMFNYVPMSGHPGGSISSGRLVSALLFDSMDYDLSDPDRDDADIISYAAGHKALGLYTLWALRNDIARIAAPHLLAADPRNQLRIEDLLGFRRNPVTDTPLFRQHGAKALDGHPTPATPFVRLSTGASGVGLSTSLGLALGAADTFGLAAPKVHIIEGEGGLTPGRVAEALAMAGTASLGNAILHIDWNQASIDSNRVCREGDQAGDYVQWDPRELCYVHDWNVINVPDGADFQQVVAAQRKAKEITNGQPTAVVYRTVKGWRYGIEGKASHGAGHKLCSTGFYEALAPLQGLTRVDLPTCETAGSRCDGGADRRVVEACFFDALTAVRSALEASGEVVASLARRLDAARGRLDECRRTPRPSAPNVQAVYDASRGAATEIPDELRLEPGASATLRGELGRVLGWYNKKSGGALLSAAADLLGSTSITAVAEGFAEGFYNARSRTDARLVSVGGICEDAMCGVLAGLSTYGRHIGVGSSYGAFIAPLGHIAARLHAIGSQARQHRSPDEPYKPFFLVCAHAGLKTGEDGPTHADPQPLQLLQENFPRGCCLTLTPWDPQEMWPLVTAALERRPAVIAPFVTRPNEQVKDRRAAGLAPATDAAKGVYALRRAKGRSDGVVVLQGSGVTYAFVEEALPFLQQKGVDLDVYYIASTELFDLLPDDEKERAFPAEAAQRAMGITGFTLPTMYRWITSPRGRRATLHPFMNGRYLGSGQADQVLREAGLDGASQATAILEYLG